MKKEIKILIILLIILLVLIAGFYLFKSFKKSTDYQWCLTNSDCHVKLNSCSCSTLCANDYYDRLATCARACKINETNQTVEVCQCLKNKCVPGLLKE